MQRPRILWMVLALVFGILHINCSFWNLRQPLLDSPRIEWLFRHPYIQHSKRIRWLVQTHYGGERDGNVAACICQVYVRIQTQYVVYWDTFERAKYMWSTYRPRVYMLGIDCVRTLERTQWNQAKKSTGVRTTRSTKHKPNKNVENNHHTKWEWR